jgi:hypothetical protein
VFLLMGPTAPLGGTEIRLRAVPGLQAVPGFHSGQFNLTDPSLGHPFGVAPTDELDQVHACCSIWVDRADGSVASALRALGEPPMEGGAWHGWLVCEAEPIVNVDHPPNAEGRIAGFAQIVALARPAHLTWTDWRRTWQDGHTAVAVNTQSTFRYVQNVVFRAVTPGAPSYAAIVEECFPEEAASDLHVFFASGGDDAKLGRHMAAMSESCDRFMDGSAPVSWTREWLF